jgi:Tol biopolymer transport system component/DNA-binding CsgD family transcriptional regulator
MSDEHPGVVAERLPPGGPPRITPREKEILYLIAEGLTDQAIAERLWVSRGTVHTHLVHLREKLQVRNRVGLVREAAHLGLQFPGMSTAFPVGGEPPLASLLAVSPRNGSDAPTATTSTRTPGTPIPGAGVLGNGNGVVDTVARRVWAGPNADFEVFLSPDGRSTPYVDWGTGDLAIRDLATGTSRRLTKNPGGPEHAFSPALSPDGRQVAYLWRNEDRLHELRLIRLDGSRPHILCRLPEDVIWLSPRDWSPDGQQILALRVRKDKTKEIVWVSAAEGTVRVIRTFDRGWPKRIRLSPDGRALAYDYPPQADTPERDIFLLASDGSRETPLVQHPADDLVVGWAPDGTQILFASDRAGALGLWRVGIAGERAPGAPELVKREMGAWSPGRLTRDGSLYYGLRAGLVDVYTATLNPATGQILAPPQPVGPRLVGSNSSPAWSPDGRSLAYFTTERDALTSGDDPEMASHVTIRSVESGETRELSLAQKHPIYISQPSWAPNGRSLVAVGFVPGSDVDEEGGRAFRIDTGTGAVTAFPATAGAVDHPRAVLAPDGMSLFYPRIVNDGKTSRGHALMARDLETGQVRELYRAHGKGITNLVLSSDGRHLAFAAGAALMVIPAAGGEPRELIRAIDGEELRWWPIWTCVAWMPDGRHLLFVRLRKASWEDRRTPLEVWRIPVAGGESERLGLAMPGLRGLRVHPDGRRIAFTAGSPEIEVWVLEGLFPVGQTA